MRYSIGDVSRLVKVKPHVIRYWEEEIPFIAPRKSLAGRRVYTERDVSMLLRLKHLLHDRKYTVEGARERLWAELQPGQADLTARVAAVRRELLKVLELLRKRGAE
jgi:DNA-binding transcriptional MerR regulator